MLSRVPREGSLVDWASITSNLCQIDGRGRGVKIILTADRTLMSKYHVNKFLGFRATAPPNVVPEWFFKALSFPPIKTKNRIPVEAPYGLRKIEAELINEEFDVLTVDSEHLSSCRGCKFCSVALRPL